MFYFYANGIYFLPFRSDSEDDIELPKDQDVNRDESYCIPITLNSMINVKRLKFKWALYGKVCVDYLKDHPFLKALLYVERYKIEEDFDAK